MRVSQLRNVRHEHSALPRGHGMQTPKGQLYDALISVNISCTLSPVFADVSTKIALISSAYCVASARSTSRLSSKSHLLPAMAMTIFSGPNDCSSCTQFCRVLKDCWQGQREREEIHAHERSSQSRASALPTTNHRRRGAGWP